MTERQHKTKHSVYTHTCQQTNPICQQNLRGCRQSFNRHPTFFFIIFAVLHLLIGIISIGFKDDVYEYKVRYDDKCNLSEENPTGTADIYFNNPPLDGNLYFYFELHDYYQTYFLMARHFSYGGISGSFEDYPIECETNASKSFQESLTCKLFRQSFFIDYYRILNSNFSDTDISWRYEKGNLYKRSDEVFENTSNWAIHPNISDFFSGESLNEHYIVWMRIASNHNFRKLYAKSVDGCSQNLHVLVNCIYPFSIYRGERFLVLLKPGGLGGKSWVIAAFNFAFFGVILLFILAFETIRYIRKRKRRRMKARKAEIKHFEETNYMKDDDDEFSDDDKF